MARHNNSSGAGGIAGLLTFLAIYLFTDTKGYKQTVSGLGTAGASFFTIGLVTLGGAFLFSNPLVFTIMASVGGGAMGIGLILGASNVIKQMMNDDTSGKNTKYANSYEFSRGDGSDNDLLYEHDYEGPDLYAGKAHSDGFKRQGEERRDTKQRGQSYGGDPRMFRGNPQATNTPKVDPKVYEQPPSAPSQESIYG